MYQFINPLANYFFLHEWCQTVFEGVGLFRGHQTSGPGVVILFFIIFSMFVGSAATSSLSSLKLSICVLSSFYFSRLEICWPIYYFQEPAVPIDFWFQFTEFLLFSLVYSGYNFSFLVLILDLTCFAPLPDFRGNVWLCSQADRKLTLLLSHLPTWMPLQCNVTLNPALPLL